jgi:hypothetical protein
MTINPIPPNGLIFAFEYISNSWVLGASGARQSTILADTDTFLFSDSLLIAGLKVQWRAAKGLDISFALADFSPLLEAAKSHDKSAPKLSLSPYGGSVLMSGANIPDGNFPGG